MCAMGAEDILFLYGGSSTIAVRDVLESRPRSQSRGGAGERVSARPAHARPHTSRNGNATRGDETDVTERIGSRS